MSQVLGFPIGDMRFPVLVIGGCIVSSMACAEESIPAAPGATESWAAHGQMTNVTQWHPRFHSPYSGANSLTANGRTEETTDLTVYVGARPWQDAEFWIDPEIDQGFGLSNTVGAAGF